MTLLDALSTIVSMEATVFTTNDASLRWSSSDTGEGTGRFLLPRAGAV
jgi:hypothetical protein